MAEMDVNVIAEHSPTDDLEDAGRQALRVVKESNAVCHKAVARNAGDVIQV